jgi:hypothetical protein
VFRVVLRLVLHCRHLVCDDFLLLLLVAAEDCLNENLFKNSVRTSKESPHFTVTKINWLTLITEIIAVYSENHIKLINPNTALQVVWQVGHYH